MKHRKLRIAWSVAWGVVAVLLVALWVRSYWWVDKVWRPTAANDGWIAWTFRGQVLVVTHAGLRAPNRLQWALSGGGDDAPVDRSKPIYGFSLGPRNYSVPILFMVLVAVMFAASSSAIAAVPWSSRFSLRTLLIAITLVAVVLGLIVWLKRALI